MGRIVTHVAITNLFEKGTSIHCDALVDTGAAYMVLPRAWKSRLGTLNTVRTVDCETATQQLVQKVKSVVRLKLKSKDLSQFILRFFFSKWNRQMVFMNP